MIMLMHVLNQRPRGKDPESLQSLALQQLSVLKIYLRDYYSQFHSHRSINDRRNVDVREVVHYWGQVETGSDSANEHVPVEQRSIACRLSWPRTYLWIGKQNLPSLNSTDETLKIYHAHYHHFVVKSGFPQI